MNILITCNSVIPVQKYGGTERVIWYLGKELSKMGHKVTFLAKKGSKCNFADIIFLEENPNIYNHLIPENIDIVHINHSKCPYLSKPYIFTVHGNVPSGVLLDKNSVFVSKNHANRFQSNEYVYNGLDWDDYGKVDLEKKRKRFHFLGNAAWRLKNVKGAINTVLKTPSEKLDVVGGSRLNFRMGFRFTLSPRIKFHGQCDNKQKAKILQDSKGLIFPVRWNEPFGLAITESLYFGCPVFGTPYGSLPEIITDEFGYLTNNLKDLANKILTSEEYSKANCHQYAIDVFNSKLMAINYLEKYEKVLNKMDLNEINPQLEIVQTQKFLDWN
jgi:glycosyltransferase involved in cell wall biosynthesis